MFAAFRPLVQGEIIPQPCHYRVVDLARGLAACSILFWHYQHFIALGMAPAGSRNGYPLYEVFGLFYDQGGAAVQFFWIISGFVFSAVYIGKSIRFGAFFQQRFARLYPLHLVTLLVITGLQWVARQETGVSIINTENTSINFVMHLFMASGWGFDGGKGSFNGVIWSVSAEVLIYVLFWVTLKHLFRWRIVLPLVASAAFFLISHLSPIAACGAYFFLGCAVYVAHRVFPLWAQYALAALGALTFLVFLSVGLQGIGALFLFAGATLACAALEASPAAKWAGKVPWIADNTYGAYLWHFPVQVAMLIGLSRLGLDRTVAYSPWFLLLFLASVTLIARASFLFIERPARDALRKKKPGGAQLGEQGVELGLRRRGGAVRLRRHLIVNANRRLGSRRSARGRCPP